MPRQGRARPGLVWRRTYSAQPSDNHCGAGTYRASENAPQHPAENESAGRLVCCFFMGINQRRDAINRRLDRIDNVQLCNDRLAAFVSAMLFGYDDIVLAFDDTDLPRQVAKLGERLQLQGLSEIRFYFHHATLTKCAILHSPVP